MQIRITYPPMKRRKVLVRSYCAHRVTKWQRKQVEATSAALLQELEEIVNAIESLEEMEMIIISLLKHVRYASIISVIGVLPLTFPCVSTCKAIGMKKWILSKKWDWRRKYLRISLSVMISLNLFLSSQSALCPSSKDMMWSLRLIKVLERPLQPSSQRCRLSMPNQTTLKSSFCLQTKL